MKFFAWLIGAAALLGAAPAMHAYTLDYQGIDGSYSFRESSPDSGVTEYAVQTGFAGQPFGTSMRARLTRGVLNSYLAVQNSQFRAYMYEVAVDGNIATVSLNDVNQAAGKGDKHQSDKIALLPGTSSFVAWDAVLLPEMLAARPDRMTCIVQQEGYELATRRITYRPFEVSRSAMGLIATCGPEAVEIWYDPKSHETLWAHSQQPNVTWKRVR